MDGLPEWEDAEVEKEGEMGTILSSATAQVLLSHDAAHPHKEQQSQVVQEALV